MASRDCPVYFLRIVRNDPALATCINCERYFRRACPVTDQLQLCNRCVLKKNAMPIDSVAAGGCIWQLDAAPSQPSSPTTNVSTQSVTPTADKPASTRRASTPSPFITPVPKAHCSSPAADTLSALPAATEEEMEQGNGQTASHLVLDPDGTIRAALSNALLYMQVFYNLLKSSHDSNARPPLTPPRPQKIYVF